MKKHILQHITDNLSKRLHYKNNRKHHILKIIKIIHFSKYLRYHNNSLSDRLINNIMMRKYIKATNLDNSKYLIKRNYLHRKNNQHLQHHYNSNKINHTLRIISIYITLTNILSVCIIIISTAINTSSFHKLTILTAQLRILGQKIS